MPHAETSMVRLSHYIAQCDQELPEAVAAKTRHHLLDTLAALISGTQLPPGKHALAYIERLGGRKECSVPGTRTMTNVVNAALAGGMCGHADETDDSHQPAFFHPGCAVVPAALAIAESRHVSGKALLRAIALGYDVGARFSLALGAMAFHQRGHSSHSFGAMFGAAAAAASVAELTPDQIRWMLSLTAQQASGISTWMRDRDHVEKSFVIGGMPARNAAYAVTMVQEGMTAVDDVLAGTPTFLSAFAPDADTGQLAAGLGKDFEIMRANIKKWSVGSPIQAALDSIQALIVEQGLKADDVASIQVQVRVDEAKIVDDRDVPNICLQHMVALLLVDGDLSFASSHDFSRMTEAAVVQLRARVKLVGSEALRRDGGRQAIVDVTTKSGKNLRHHTKVVRGAAGNEMTDAEVQSKCLGLIAPSLGERRALRLMKTVSTIADLPDVAALRALWAPGREPSGTATRR